MDPRRPWIEVPLHVLDFEGSRRTGVVEWGVVTLLGGQLVELRTERCAPLAPLALSETRCHGLVAADLAGHRPFSAYWSEFQNLRQSGVFVSHHAGVEATLLTDTWPHPAAVPAVAEVASSQAAWGPWVDTLTLARQHRPGLKDYSLGALIKSLGVEPQVVETAARLCPPDRAQPHCAGYDALAAACLLLRMIPPYLPLGSLLSSAEGGAPQSELAF